MSDPFFPSTVQWPGSQTGGSTDAKDLLLQAKSSMTRGDSQEARRLLERALERDPFLAAAHNELSAILWRLRETEAALDHLTRALELDPNDAAIIINCVKVFRELGKDDDAREILENYLARKPWDQEVRKELDRQQATPQAPRPENLAGFLNDEGERRFADGKMTHARACFEIATEHDPNNARARSNLGVLCWREGNLEEALRHLYRAIELDPEDSDILYNSASVLQAAGELDAAEDLLRLYLQRNPSDEPAWEGYTSLLTLKGDSSWKADGLSQEVAAVYLSMGKKLVEVKDHQGASEAFARALMIDPEKADAYFELGTIHQELNQEEDALHMFNEALRVNAGHKASVLAKGELLIRQGRTEDAEQLYRSFLGTRKDREIEQALKKMAVSSQAGA